jgi:hypothetical protein
VPFNGEDVAPEHRRRRAGVTDFSRGKIKGIPADRRARAKEQEPSPRFGRERREHEQMRW